VLLQALKDVRPHEPLFYSYGDMDDAAQALLTYGCVQIVRFVQFYVSEFDRLNSYACDLWCHILYVASIL
jgi:hypothetical protein